MGLVPRLMSLFRAFRSVVGGNPPVVINHFVTNTRGLSEAEAAKLKTDVEEQAAKIDAMFARHFPSLAALRRQESTSKPAGWDDLENVR